jgi:hypothetical protein
MARLRSIPHNLGQFFRADPHRRALLIEAALFLLLARAALVLIPFPRLARRLGAFVAAADLRPTPARASRRREHVIIAEEIGWAVRSAARRVPFRAVCLPQAISARIMLKRRHVPSVIHFGAAKGTKREFYSHAWIDAAGVEVTGYPLESDFTEIACFAD